MNGDAATEVTPVNSVRAAARVAPAALPVKKSAALEKASKKPAPVTASSRGQAKPNAEGVSPSVTPSTIVQFRTALPATSAGTTAPIVKPPVLESKQEPASLKSASSNWLDDWRQMQGRSGPAVSAAIQQDTSAGVTTTPAPDLRLVTALLGKLPDLGKASISPAAKSTVETELSRRRPVRGRKPRSEPHQADLLTNGLERHADKPAEQPEETKAESLTSPLPSEPTAFADMGSSVAFDEVMVSAPEPAVVALAALPLPEEEDLRQRDAALRQAEVEFQQRQQEVARRVEQARHTETTARERELAAAHREETARRIEAEAKQAIERARQQQEEATRSIAAERTRREEAERVAAAAKDEAARLTREAAERARQPTAQSVFGSMGQPGHRHDASSHFHRARPQVEKVSIVGPGKGAKTRVVDVVKLRGSTGSLSSSTSLSTISGPSFHSEHDTAAGSEGKSILTLSGLRTPEEIAAAQSRLLTRLPAPDREPADMGHNETHHEGEKPTNTGSMLAQLKSDPLVVNALKIATMVRRASSAPDIGRRAIELIQEMHRTLSGMELGIEAAKVSAA